MPTLLSGRRAEASGLLARWDDLVDPRVGIIRAVEELPIDDDEPDFFHYLSTACDTARFTVLSNFGNNGGAAMDRYSALAKAIGEAVERYCAAIFRYRDLVLARHSDLQVRATPPSEFALYRPDQFDLDNCQWQPFTPEALVAWTPGRSLLTGEEVLVPAASVFVPYHFQLARGETPIMQPISTGLAAGCSFAQASLSGVCEVLERDAFTLTWQGRLSRPRVVPKSLPESGRDLIRRFNDVGVDVHVLDITQDIAVPTIMTVALGDAPTSPAVAVAAATDPTPERALIKSLEELAHTRKFARQVMEYTPPLLVDVEGGHPLVREQQDHLRFYCPQPAKDFISFAWASTEWRPFGTLSDARAASPEQELRRVVELAAAAGYEPIACELTTPDIAALGLSVVRVVIPGLNPLFMGHRNRALGGERLRRLAGVQSGQPDNPYPHPFP